MNPYSRETSNENYKFIEFESDEQKDKVDWYFINFNASARQQAMIALPDFYEGGKEIVKPVCEFYWRQIELKIGENLNQMIAIPFGISDNNPNDRMFMIYNDKEMLGLYPGREFLKGHPVAFVNPQQG